MASKVDMSLDDLVKIGGRGRGRGGGGVSARGRGRGRGGRGARTQGNPVGQRSSGPAQQHIKIGTKQLQTGKGTGKNMNDLRDVLSKKQNSNIGDLRSKLKPKALYTSKNVKSPPKTVAPKAPVKPRRSTGTTPKGPITSPSKRPEAQKRRSRRSDPGPQLRHRDPKSNVSYEEAKKITVTVPGMSRPVSEYTPRHGREERLAAAIARSKELRHESYMRGREEVLASAITSAFGGPSATSGHNDRAVGSLHRMPLHGYSRSPSPVPDFNYDSHQFSLPPARAPFQPKPARGITTMTSMLISNLSDTVSKNDISELCSAVGPLESVTMPAPGMVEVIFKFKDDALEAFKKYNQRNLDGQPMVCKLQPASRTRLSGSFGYGQSYADDFYGAPSSGFY